jgi:uncharacterized protein (TIGR02271 family)
MPAEPSETVLPLAAETLRVEKRLRETGRVRVSLQTETVEEVVRHALMSRDIDIERVLVGRQVEAVPPVRQEGGVLIVPVVEEVLVVEKRLVLREEIHLKLNDTIENTEEVMKRRVQRAVVERLSPQSSGGGQPEPAEGSSLLSGLSPMNRTITGLFDTREAAEAVIAHLTTHDSVPRDRITLHAANAGTTGSDMAEDDGLWGSIKSLFVPDEDRHAYSEGVRRGGVLLSAELEEHQVSHAMDVFEEHGAVDLDSREQEWRNDGWTGVATPAIAPTGTPVLGMASDTAATTDRFAETTARTPDLSGRDEQVIPVVEEQLRVSKRDTESGRVRVRSYVTETPVSEQVSLREEHVNVQRRPVDRALTSADDAFRDRSIEAVEHREEAVVSKDARIVEEVVLNKAATERTETINDTVRKQDVEIEDSRDRPKSTLPGV